MVHVVDKNSCPLSQKFSIMLKEVIVQGILTGSKSLLVLFNYQQIFWTCFGVVFFLNGLKISLNSLPQNT
jgi:hypothetical protein